MSLKFPNGTQFGFSTTIGPAISVSAISAANPAEVTFSGGSLTGGEIVVIESSHPMLNNLATQVGDVVSTEAELLGLDTTDSSIYDNLNNTTAKLFVASGFVDFTQQGDPTTSGGEQQYWQGTFLEDRTGQQISVPTFKNAKVITIPLYYDKSQAWYAAAQKVDLKKSPVVLRAKLPGGDVLYRYGYLSFDADPNMAANAPMTNTATFTSLGRAITVEAAP